MISPPYIVSFLCRSRSFWLTLFTLVFFAWAWRDSTRNSTELFLRPHASGIYLLQSADGWVNFSSKRKPNILKQWFNRKYSSGSEAIQFYRGINFGLEDKNSPPPGMHYATLMIMTLLSSAAWQVGRWRRMRKHPADLMK